MIIEVATPDDLARLLAFREEAAAWLSGLGSDQWRRPYPPDRLLATIEAGTVFMVRDGGTTAATITVTPEAEDGLWLSEELAEPSLFVNKLTVARTHAGRDLGGGCSIGRAIAHIVLALPGSASTRGRRMSSFSATTFATALSTFAP